MTGRVVAVTGASGLVGRALQVHLGGLGHEVRAVRRTDEGFDRAALVGADAVVHLAGEPISQRWSKRAKARIRDSRELGTQRLVATLATIDPRPRALISASAVGWYGDRGDEVLSEESAGGQGYLAEVCAAWEAAAERAADHGVRVVTLRTGIVLARDGGALGQMLTPFRLGLGGRLGSGRQWMSWLAIEDLVRVVEAAVLDETWRGPINATSPEPATNQVFTKALARALGRPAFLAVPRFALRWRFGELADAALLASQRVEPARLVASGFDFHHPTLAPTLAALLGKAPRSTPA